jgi:hypothetical protein
MLEGEQAGLSVRFFFWLLVALGWRTLRLGLMLELALRVR